MPGRGAGSTYVVSSDQPNLYKCIRQLKREEHSLFSCLNSIYDDAAFVNEIAVLYPSLPVFANLRCGLWYLPHPKHTCYFKSTDGHTGNWSFSTTRLNWHVAELAAQRGGCIIVDATRKGKRFPDALSKTIPVWAAVINRAIARVRQHDERKAQRRRHQEGTEVSPVADTQTEVPLAAPAATTNSIRSNESSSSQTAEQSGGTHQQQQQQQQQQGVEGDSTAPLDLAPTPSPSVPGGTSCAADNSAGSSASCGLHCSRLRAVATTATPSSSAQVLAHYRGGPRTRSPTHAPAAATGVSSSNSSISSPQARQQQLLLGPRTRSALLSPQPSLHEWLDDSPRRVLRPSSSAPCDGSYHPPQHTPAPLPSPCPGVHDAVAVPLRTAPQPFRHAPCQQQQQQQQHQQQSQGRSSSLTLDATPNSLAQADDACYDPCTPRLGSLQALAAFGGAEEGSSAGATPPAAAHAIMGAAGGWAAAAVAPASQPHSCFIPGLLAAAAEPAAPLAAAAGGAGAAAAAGGNLCVYQPLPAGEEAGFAFPPPEQLAQQAASSASGTSPSNSPVVGPLSADAAEGGVPPDAPLPLPCMPVVVLNGTSHQPAVASSILNIWRAADLEELSELPRLEEMLPGVVHLPPLPLRTSSGGSGPHPHSSWPCLPPLGGDSGVFMEGPWALMSATGAGMLPGGMSPCGFIPHSCPASLVSSLLPDELVLLQAGSVPASLAPALATAAGGGSSGIPRALEPPQEQGEQQEQEAAWLGSRVAGGSTTSRVTSSQAAAAGPAMSTSSVGSGGGSSLGASSPPGPAGGASSPSGASPSSSSSWMTTWLADREVTPDAGATPDPAPAPAAAAAAAWDTGLHLPLWVSDQERQQMEARLDAWVEQLLAVGANVRGLAAALTKPLRPLWVSQDSLIWTNQVAQPSSLPFTPLILVTASQQQQQSQRRTCRLVRGSSDGGGTGPSAASSDKASDWSYVYTPGAGDDEEHWAAHLSPGLFWEHHEQLLSAGPQEVVSLAQQLRQQARGGSSSSGGSGRPGSPGSSSSGRGKPGAKGGPAPVDVHHLAPRGCVASSSSSAAAASVPGLPGAYYVGGTGLAVGALPSGTASSSSRHVWAAFDAVLCCSEQMEGCLQQEWALQQANQDPATPLARSAPQPVPRSSKDGHGSSVGVGGGGSSCGSGSGKRSRQALVLEGDLAASLQACSPRSRARVVDPEATCLNVHAASSDSSSQARDGSSPGTVPPPAADVLSAGAQVWVQGRGGSLPGDTWVTPPSAHAAASPRRGGMLSALLQHQASQEAAAAAAAAVACTDPGGVGESGASGGAASGAAGIQGGGGEQQQGICRPLVAETQHSNGAASSEAPPTCTPTSSSSTAAAAAGCTVAEGVGASCVPEQESAGVVAAAMDPTPTPAASSGQPGGLGGEEAVQLRRLLWVPVRHSKYERCGLRLQLQQMLEFVSAHLAAGRRVLITDAEGHDTSVCVAVALLLGCYSDGDGAAQQWPVFLQRWSGAPHCGPVDLVTKHSVRQRLALVSACYPPARPTRGMLKQVFNFFEQRRRGQGPGAAVEPL